ncbi:MAG: DUF2298 domain-containing protein [Halolamina sp.]
MEFGLVAVWLSVYAGLAALGYPIAARLFRRFPDRGAGLALPTALVVVTLPVFWLGRVAYGPLTVAVGVAVLAATSLAAALDLDALRRGELSVHSSLAVDRGPVARVAVAFLLSFLFLVTVRAFDPAVHAIGGEKYLDFSLLRTLSRSPTLPPEDPWFAGSTVRYYYGGHLMTSVLAHLTATASRFAYNLSLSGFYAMLVAAAFSLAAAVADARGRAGTTAGAAAAFFVGVAANLEPVGKLLVGALPAGLREAVAPSASDGPWYYTLDGLEAQFSYWDASRVVGGTITEFPLFAWLNGDLHAHMMGTPFLLLAAALGFALYRTPADQRRRRLGLLGAVAAVGGVQAAVDTWSFPSVFGLTWLALAFASAPPWALAPPAVAAPVADWADGSRLRAEIARPVVAVVAVGVVGAVAVALAAPFFATAVFGGAGNRSIALLPVEMRSPLGSFLLVHGAFLALFWTYVGGRVDEPALAALGVVAVGAVAVAVGLPAAALVVPVLVGAWTLARMDGTAGYETVLLAAGAGLVLLVEVVFVNEQAGPGRMNTVFKTYMQVWVLWATAAGVVVADLSAPSGFGAGLGATGRRLFGATTRADGGVVEDDGADPSDPSRRADAGEGAAALVTRRLAVRELLVVAVLLTTSLYGGLALAEQVAASRADPTLDATQFADERHPTEAEAIAWLDERATAEDVLLSAPGTSRAPSLDRGSYPHPPGMYRWGSNPAATLTGVPTVAGWAHEVGYRGPDAYYGRVVHVDDSYTGLDAAVTTLRRYDVTYVYVGPTERARYGAALVEFEQIPGIEPAFENERVTVYRVDSSELPEN